jgi:hypothetical protein
VSVEVAALSRTCRPNTGRALSLMRAHRACAARQCADCAIVCHPGQSELCLSNRDTLYEIPGGRKCRYKNTHDLHLECGRK